MALSSSIKCNLQIAFPLFQIMSTDKIDDLIKEIEKEKEEEAEKKKKKP